MKGKIFICLVAVMLAAAAIVYITPKNTSAAYTEANDPLITLSYLQSVLVPQLEESIKAKVLEELKTVEQTPEVPPESIETPPEENPDNTNTPSADNNGEELKYKVLHLTCGQKLMASGTNEEATEIILRAGEAVCLSPFEDQGIADITASAELMNGDVLTKNNYCIIPRGSDGRGIEVISEELYLMVRGAYEIVQ